MVEGGPHGETETKASASGASGPFRIFINYRRDDSAGHVGRLWDALRSGVEGQPGFSEDQIFMDIDTIEPGVDFREAIRRAVEASDVFLTVIGNRWLTAADSAGRRRLDNPGDFVRLEIEAALDRAARHHDVRVVPTRVQGADMPGVEDLPESLSPLAHRNAIELTDERWHYDVGRLLASLKKLEREKLDRSRAAERPEPVAPEPKEKRPDQERRYRVGKPAIGTAVVVAVAAVAALAIAFLGDGDEPSDGTTRPERAALAWERAPSGALGGEGDQAMSSIVDTARGGLAYVAGGYDTSTGTRDGAIWTSPDGREWRRTGGDAFERPGDQEITSVAPFGGALVAVGSDDSNGDKDIAVWTSSDGAAWEDPVVPRAEGTDEVVNRVTTTRIGLVGAGWQTDDGDDDAAVWVVPAGQALEEASARAVSDPDLGGPGDQRITSVVQLGSQLVAVGFADGDAGVWVSDDGEAWDRVEASSLGGDADQEMLDAARFESTVVAVGRDGQRGAVWLSSDGRSWTRVPDPEDGFAGSESVRLNRVYDAGLASRGAALVAGGSADGDAAVWVSNDAREWSREPARALGGEGDQAITSFRKGEGGVIAVGSTESDEGLDAAVWFGAGAE